MATHEPAAEQRTKTPAAETTVYSTRDTCRLCESSSLTEVWSFGHTPLANDYLSTSQLDATEPMAPLNVHRCETCGLAQLRDVVRPELLFSEYLYVSSTSPTFVKHFESYAQNLKDRYELGAQSLVIDIGSNDGVLLKPLKAAGIRVLGVDPAENIAAAATADGIPTIPAFLSPEVAQKIVAEHGQADVVTANNVFAHTDEVDSFVEGVTTLLNEDGVFVFEVQYLADLIEQNLFDIVYHEHVCYYHLHPLVSFFAKHDMTIVDAERVPVHGGSIRVSVAKKSSARARQLHARVQAMLQAENTAGLNATQAFTDFWDRVQENRTQLRAILDRIAAEGKRVAGYGAPAKATTLTYAFGLTKDDLSYIVDDAPLKQGRFMPGSHIPIVPANTLYTDAPDYCLLLAWNFAEPIMKSHQRFTNEGGTFIIPVPTPRLVS